MPGHDRKEAAARTAESEVSAEQQQTLDRVRPLLGEEALNRFMESADEHSKKIAVGLLNTLADVIEPFNSHVSLVPDPIGDTVADTEAKSEVESDKRLFKKAPPKAFTDIFGELPSDLVETDLDAFVSTITHLPGAAYAFDGVIVPGKRLRKLIIGESAQQIVDDEGRGSQPASVHSWLSFYRNKITAETTQHEAMESLITNLALAREAAIDEQAEEPEIITALPPHSAEDLVEPQPEASSTPEDDEYRIGRLRDVLVGRLDAKSSPENSNGESEEAKSLRKLLTLSTEPNDRNVDRKLARDVIASLMQQYAPVRVNASGVVFSEKVDYDCLRYLSGNGINVQQERPLTIDMLANKFRTQLDGRDVREVVTGALGTLFDMADNDTAPTVEKPRPPVAVQKIAETAIKEVKKPENVKQTTESIDMFAVAKGEVQVEERVWVEAVRTLFERSVSNGSLTKLEAHYIHARIYSKGGRVGEDTSKALKKLQNYLADEDRSRRLREDKTKLALVEAFVYPTAGALPLKEMHEKLQRNSKNTIRPQRVEREFFGGLSEILGVNK